MTESHGSCGKRCSSLCCHIRAWILGIHFVRCSGRVHVLRSLPALMISIWFSNLREGTMGKFSLDIGSFQWLWHKCTNLQHSDFGCNSNLLSFLLPKLHQSYSNCPCVPWRRTWPGLIIPSRLIYNYTFKALHSQHNQQCENYRYNEHLTSHHPMVSIEHPCLHTKNVSISSWDSGLVSFMRAIIFLRSDQRGDWPAPRVRLC